ncbi:MAG TPA: cell division protein ZapA [Gammaproteobacteria bacterium]|nr:cell division protein ZapA [Gammaproteobacteria bacterium]
MADDTVPVTVTILDKEFRVACRENEQGSLLASADLLSARMREVRDSGKVFGSDRIAIIAALNLTHELLHQRNQNGDAHVEITERIKALQAKIEGSLQKTQQIEF